VNVSSDYFIGVRQSQEAELLGNTKEYRGQNADPTDDE
jgi:hypothetical protein